MTCSVCRGRGFVDEELVNDKPCHVCHGRGWTIKEHPTPKEQPMIYHTRRETVEAVQFNKFGDHPAVLKVQRYCELPHYMLATPAMTEVKFGDYIINCEVGYIVMKKAEFEAKYINLAGKDKIVLNLPVDNPALAQGPVDRIVLMDRAGNKLAQFDL